MRNILIAAILGLSLIACEKDKTDTSPTGADASTSVDGNAQDGVAPAEDVTSAADVTSTTSPSADVTVTD